MLVGSFMDEGDKGDEERYVKIVTINIFIDLI